MVIYMNITLVFNFCQIMQNVRSPALSRVNK